MQQSEESEEDGGTEECWRTCALGNYSIPILYKKDIHTYKLKTHLLSTTMPRVQPTYYEQKQTTSFPPQKPLYFFPHGSSMAIVDNLEKRESKTPKTALKRAIES